MANPTTLLGNVSADNLLSNPTSDLFNLGSTASDLGGVPGQANFGLLSVPLSFLNPTANQTFNPTVTQTPTQTGFFNNNLDFSQIGGPSNSASIFGGGGGGGQGNSANVSQTNNNQLVSNLPAPLQAMAAPNLLPGMPQQNIMTAPNMMPMPQPNSPMGQMMNTPQPIAAGGISPIMAGMMAIPQQQQLSGGQPIIPGTAAQAGGYDMPQLPMGMGANAMGIPNFPQSFGQPRIAPQNAPGNIATAGGQQIPTNQITANRGNGLVPPPPPNQPSMLASSIAEPQVAAQPEDTGIPMDTNQMEQDALNRSEATTRQGIDAINQYYSRKKAKEDKRNADKTEDVKEPLARKIAAQTEKDKLAGEKELQESEVGQAKIAWKAHVAASRAVELRRAGNAFPVPQYRAPQSVLHREPLIHLGGGGRQTYPDPITQRGLEEQEGSLYNSVYNASITHSNRDLTGEQNRAETNWKDADKEVKDIETAYGKREEREERSTLRELNAALNKARLNQGTAETERKVGHGTIMENIAQQNANKGTNAFELAKNKWDEEKKQKDLQIKKLQEELNANIWTGGFAKLKPSAGIKLPQYQDWLVEETKAGRITGDVAKEANRKAGILLKGE